MAGDSTRLIQIEKLNDGNYGIWKDRMECSLVVNRLFKYVEQTLAADANATTKENDKIALSYIKLGCDAHILSTLSDCKTAKDAWELLANTYQAKLNARIMTLQDDLHALHIENAESLEKYVDRAKTLYQELKAAGDNTKEVHVVTSLLRGLPSHYRMIVTAMNANDKPLTFDYVLPKLLSEEQHVRRHDEHGTAFLAQQRGSQRGGFSNHGNRPFCTHCKKMGHTIDRCFQLHPHLAPPRQGQPQGQAVAMTAYENAAWMAVSPRPRPGEGVWAVDCGATQHITPYMHLLSNFRKTTDQSITSINGESFKAYGVGDVCFTTFVSGQKSPIVLKNVLYVPDATANVISLHRTLQAGVIPSFTPDFAEFSRSGKVLARADNNAGLFYIKAAYKCEPIKVLSAVEKQIPHAPPAPPSTSYRSAIMSTPITSPSLADKHVCAASKSFVPKSFVVHERQPIECVSNFKFSDSVSKPWSINTINNDSDRFNKSAIVNAHGHTVVKPRHYVL